MGAGGLIERASLVRLMAAVLVVAGLAGCGSSRGTIPLSGRVLVAGRPPQQGGRVIFTPLPPGDPGDSPVPGGRFALGVFGADGLYRASSFTDGDGILPGRYEVAVELGEMRQATQDPHNLVGTLPPAGRAAPSLEVRRDGPRAIRHDIELR